MKRSVLPGIPVWLAAAILSAAVAFSPLPATASPRSAKRATAREQGAIKPERLATEIAARRSRVPQFEAIAEMARARGLRVRQGSCGGLLTKAKAGGPR